MIPVLVFVILAIGLLTLLSGLWPRRTRQAPARHRRPAPRRAADPSVAPAAPVERPFTGEFWDHDADGTYDCASCGAPLFDANTKFDADDGWPNFRRPVHGAAVSELSDISYGQVRLEAVCRGCDARLGHIFAEGPAAADGRRYCLNSAALVFRPRHGVPEPRRRAQ